MRFVQDGNREKYSRNKLARLQPVRDMSVNLEFTIRQAVWLFPACIAAHFLEEAFGFAKWARDHISPRYSDARWRRIHGMGFVSALAASALVSVWPRPVSVFLFTAIFLTPMVFNAMFHLATSVFFRSYSPGATSALLLFPALCWRLVSISSDAGLLSARSAMAATVVGAAFHTMDLASTTFFLRRTPRL
jgi:uncharacterized protein with HXXEE motif